MRKVEASKAFNLKPLILKVEASKAEKNVLEITWDFLFQCLSPFFHPTLMDFFNGSGI